MLRPLRNQLFDPTVVLRAMIERTAQIPVRGSCYSPPTAYAGRSLEMWSGRAGFDIVAGGQLSPIRRARAATPG
ncbi:MAG: hypothetical protein OXH40_05985 [Chloroflexi bacterium]|nr:hypothetical protein [Chloroflexota bacterium]MCY3687074.1 hypothetical protein [Chloroflexota bacterium]MDE2708621.1 hypothetical protein [Chloroflexota bacterium]